LDAVFCAYQNANKRVLLSQLTIIITLNFERFDSSSSHFQQ